MNDFLDQIEAAANNARLYYLALAGALVIPDICGALETAGGAATRETYIGWFDTHLTPVYSRRNGPPVLTGEDCWKFRCSFLHQGRTQHPRSGYSRIMFIEPGANTNVFHMAIMGDTLNIDVRLFCLDMVNAARRWISTVDGTEPYQSNLSAFVRRHPNGFAPYIVGTPVIT